MERLRIISGKHLYSSDKKWSATTRLHSISVIRLGLEPKTPTLKVLCSTY